MALTIGYDGKYFWQGMNRGGRSGHGIHAQRLLEEMLALDAKSRFRVYVVDEDSGLDVTSNCEFARLPNYARNPMMRSMFAYPVELVRRPVDVFLSYTVRPIYAPCKTVLLLADINWIVNPEWLPGRMAVPRGYWTRFSVARADRIVTTTEFSRQEIIQRLNVPEEKIVVVPHGIRTEFTERLSPDRIAEVRSKHGIREDYVLSLNDIHPRKNLEGLIEAFERLKSRTKLPHQLVIAGQPLWPYPEFYRRVEESPFVDDIALVGYVPSEDVLAVYQGARMFVYPSFYEGWGLQVHEAMISGVPVAVANNTTMVEISGDAAESFDPYDTEDMSHSIERVLTDSQLRDTLVARGYEQVKKYSWRDAAEATLAVCADVASE